MGKILVTVEDNCCILSYNIWEILVAEGRKSVSLPPTMFLTVIHWNKCVSSQTYETGDAIV
jgi:hypothetical protein